MSRAKITVLACIASLALLVVASSSASAAEWNVNKAVLGSGKSELATGTTTTKNFELALGGINITVTCTGLQNNSAFIVGPTLFEAKSISLTGCTSSSATCPVNSVVGSNELSGASGSSFALKIGPRETGHVLFIVEFEGAFCPLSAYPVKGNFTMTSGSISTEQGEHELVVSSSELNTGGDIDTLTGAADFKLASGQTWSFH